MLHCPHHLSRCASASPSPYPTHQQLWCLLVQVHLLRSWCPYLSWSTVVMVQFGLSAWLMKSCRGSSDRHPAAVCTQRVFTWNSASCTSSTAGSTWRHDGQRSVEVPHRCGPGDGKQLTAAARSSTPHSNSKKFSAQNHSVLPGCHI